MAADQPKDSVEKDTKTKRREIQGNLTYTISPGVLEKALKALRDAERPNTFNADFLEGVLHLSGGSARAVPPVLKRMKFISADGSPTDLYASFQSEGGKSQAALDGLRNAFPSIFQKNTYAHKLPKEKIKDIVVEITGLPKNDNIISKIISTFFTIQDFISGEYSEEREKSEPAQQTSPEADSPIDMRSDKPIGLSYQINIVLPDTTDINVFNAIFKSLKENLL